DASAGAVTLMTLHAAKGLEFPSVFIIGLEDGLLPAQRPSESDDDIEEERRLCFVGITRARQELVLTRARWRMRYGQTLRTVASPFLSELPSSEIESITLQSTGRRRGGSIPQGGDLPDDIEHWEVGTLVRERHRGLGRLLDLHRGGGGLWAKVEFQDGTRRTFNLGFAQLERVDYHEVD
ncbi:MAG: ATP-binding domain-containing protein, partial [Planctomycetes bacterium]|nr:ATP-binding domain-containing protein [Planctomycetota bacterium]